MPIGYAGKINNLIKSKYPNDYANLTFNIKIA